MTTVRERVRYLDIARGIAIIAVVALHTNFLPLQHQVLPLMTPWMLPVFAVISGILSSQKSYRPLQEVVVSKFKSLIIPYYGIGLFSYCLWLGLRWYAVESVIFLSWVEGLWQLLVGYGMVYNGPLWFLPAYFIASILFDLICKSMRDKPSYLYVFFFLNLAMLSLVANPWHTYTYFSFDLALLFAGFMCLGRWLSKIHSEKWHPFVWIGIGVMFAALALHNGTIDMFARSFHNPFIYWITASVGSFLVIHISKILARSGTYVVDSLSTIGKFSLIILCTHWAIMQWLTFFLSFIGVLRALNGIPTYTSFSYDLPNAVLFTLIEVPLLVLYMLVPLIIVPLARRLQKID